MPFFLIHDSFATTAGKTQKLYEVIRESFIDMYANDSWYEYLLEQVKAQLDDPDTRRVPETPDLGELDLKLIAESKYCFS